MRVFIKKKDYSQVQRKKNPQLLKYNNLELTRTSDKDSKHLYFWQVLGKTTHKVDELCFIGPSKLVNYKIRKELWGQFWSNLEKKISMRTKSFGTFCQGAKYIFRFFWQCFFLLFNFFYYVISIYPCFYTQWLAIRRWLVRNSSIVFWLSVSRWQEIYMGFTLKFKLF